MAVILGMIQTMEKTGFPQKIMKTRIFQKILSFSTLGIMMISILQLMMVMENTTR